MWLCITNRKTNHELFEEDGNKLAIGYRLILGVLVSFCLSPAQISFAQVGTWEIKNCSISVKSMVYQSDEFCGEKKSKAQAIQAIYKFQIGRFDANVDESSAMLSCKSNALCATVTKVNGVSNSLLCTNSENGISFMPKDKNWKRLASAIADEEARCASGSSVSQTNESQQRQSTNACNAFYQGKSIGFKPAGFSYFGSVLDAVVLGKGNGNVSIKIVDSNFTDLYGKTLEMSCTSDQLQ